MVYDMDNRTMTGVWLLISRNVMWIGDPCSPTRVSIRQARAWSAREDLRFDDDNGDWYEVGEPDGEGEQCWIDLMEHWNLDPSRSYECYMATIPVEYWGSKRLAENADYKRRVRQASDDLHNPSFPMDGSRAGRVRATASMYGVNESDLEGGGR